ncbi:hypothetical protein AB0G83_21800, partial [Streptomyces klenkii]|uniref:hypothetical protein n=1 Tax=Streptomyces klenkii TaxID=1420899 RepID=UPI003401EAC9
MRRSRRTTAGVLLAACALVTAGTQAAAAGTAPGRAAAPAVHTAARAFAHAGRVLILDDATSSLDTA